MGPHKIFFSDDAVNPYEAVYYNASKVYLVIENDLTVQGRTYIPIFFYHNL